MPRASYEIRVEGVVQAELIEDFEGVSAMSAVSGTTLRADLIDTSALHGLLEALRRADLVLLDVRRVLWAGDDPVLDIDDPTG